MKIKKEFVMRRIDDECLLVPVKKPPPSQHSVRLLQLSILLLCDQFGVPKRLQQLV